MGANEPKIPFTYEDYKVLSASADQRYELMDGELLLVPAPSTRHQIVAKNLLFLLEQHVRPTGGGQVLGAPLDVVLGRGSKRNVVQPDILYVSSTRLQIITTLEVAGAPDLVVEILSPATAERDRGMKKTLYARAGVREYWLVDPESELIEVFRLGKQGYEEPLRFDAGDRLVSSVLEGFTPPVHEVFRKR